MKKLLSVVVVSLFCIGCAPKNAPSSCDCVNLLMLKPDLKTNVPMDNKTFDKWKKCKKYHTGYATAVLKCQKLKSKKWDK